MLTTNHVLGETWTFLRRRRGHSDALRAVDAVCASPSVTLMRVPKATEDDAWDWLRRNNDRGTHSWTP